MSWERMHEESQRVEKQLRKDGILPYTVEGDSNAVEEPSPPKVAPKADREAEAEVAGKAPPEKVRVAPGSKKTESVKDALAKDADNDNG